MINIMYYILGFVGKKVDEVKLKSIIKTLHKDDYKKPDINLIVNITFLSESLLDDSLSNQLKSLNTNMSLEYRNKENILLDIYRNKINGYINDDTSTITYIIINNVCNKTVLELVRSYKYHKLYFMSNNKKPSTNIDFYTYRFINKIIKVFYGYVYLEHLYEYNDEWINIDIKGEYDFKILDSIKNIRNVVHKTLKDYRLINKYLGVHK